ncbi:MAG: class I SAM-dependent methyltransferase [Bryobacterales bacterium]|nr:class I SAM-dependent methyltransferase [Bryobacterales bacterium]
MLDSIKGLIDRVLTRREQDGHSTYPHHHQERRSPSTVQRPSTAIQEFFGGIRDQMGLHIADFSGACQENVTFITSLGHRMYAESFPYAVAGAFGPDPSPADLKNPEKIGNLLRGSFGFDPKSVDAILLWDALEWLDPEGSRAVVGRILDVLRPNGTIFAVFHSESVRPYVPVHYFKLLDPETIAVTDAGIDRKHCAFTNRSIEKTFEQCQSVKFFLSRDNLREVIIRR